MRRPCGDAATDNARRRLQQLQQLQQQLQPRSSMGLEPRGSVGLASPPAAPPAPPQQQQPLLQQRQHQFLSFAQRPQPRNWEHSAHPPIASPPIAGEAAPPASLSQQQQLEQQQQPRLAAFRLANDHARRQLAPAVAAAAACVRGAG